MNLSISFLYIFNLIDIHTLAFLYADPGSGALIWQLLVASFFGILFYVRTFIRKIKGRMPGSRSKDESDQQAAVANGASVEKDGANAPNRKMLQ
jgi:hypothetical protein